MASHYTSRSLTSALPLHSTQLFIMHTAAESQHDRSMHRATGQCDSEKEIEKGSQIEAHTISQIPSRFYWIFLSMSILALAASFSSTTLTVAMTV